MELFSIRIQRTFQLVSTKEDRPLTLKQENFCQYYVDIEGNASEAYRMAYNASKMKAESVWTEASLLLSNPKVSQRINQIKEQRAKDSAVRREAVEKVLYDIVMADPKDLYILDSSTGKVKLKRPDQMPKRIRNAMKKITNKKGEVSYEFTGKTEAARLLGAWNGWDAEKTINVKNDGDKIGELRIGFDENDKSDK